MIDLTKLWVTEWISCAFFGYLIVLAARRPLSRRHRIQVIAVSIVCGGLAVMLSQLRLSPILRVGREWLPGVYLIQGYWSCGLFFQRPMVDVERRLLGFDRELFRRLHLSDLVTRGPRVVLEYFELAYLLAYPFVPVSFAVFYWLGAREQADSFWTTLLIAGFGAYGVLPWIQTRPPRALEDQSAVDGRGLLFRRLNVAVLDHASVQVNTFPSGHASVAVAAALAVTSINLGVGLVFGLLAISIVVATVLGRYHYAVDSFVGLILGVAAWWYGFRVV